MATSFVSMVGCRAGRSIVVVLLLASIPSLAWSDPTEPTAEDHNITLAVAKLLEKEHLSRHRLDKQMSERCFKAFLKRLDPLRVYFYQSDIDEFAKRQEDLGRLALKGDVNFAYTVFRTFLRRVDERVKMVDDLLVLPCDFGIDEEIVIDRDAAEYAKTPAEAQDRWRKQIKYDLLVLKSGKGSGSKGKPSETNPEKLEGKAATDKIAKRYHNVAKQWHQTDGAELLEMYLNAFPPSYDPHSDYMSPDTLKNFDIAMSLELEGIGASLMSEDGYTVVKKLIPGGAADKNGQLKVEDKIVGVGQDSADVVDVVEMKLSDVVKLIRGARGTTVRLDVMPAGGGETKTIKIVREKIELTDSEARGEVFEAGRKADGSPYHVGVIDLPSFYMDMAGARRGLPDYRSTTRDVRNILDDFNKKQVDAVVLDLRANGGGSLTEAINLTGLFISEGPVVQVKDADGHVQSQYDLDPDTVWSGPLVVLTSKLSASASEILAGAIQDYGRGLIIGDPSTHGKGTVQSLVDLSQKLLGPNGKPMGALKITMQQFYRPGGESTQKRGVLADIELPSIIAGLAEGEAQLDYPLEFDKVEPQNYKRFGNVNPTVCDQLRRLSEQRTQSSEKFQKTVRTAARYDEQKRKKTMTIQEEKFLKERAELQADREQEDKDFDKLAEHNGIERDYYLDEVLAIVSDYLNIQYVANVQRPAAEANN